MSQAKVYLQYLIYAGLVVCFVMTLWQMLMHRQWKLALLAFVFVCICFGNFALQLGGFLIALIIGWQEAGNWKIKNLMRVYTVLFVISLILASRDFYRDISTPKPQVDLKAKGKAKAPPAFPKPITR